MFIPVKIIVIPVKNIVIPAKNIVIPAKNIVIPAKAGTSQKTTKALYSSITAPHEGSRLRGNNA
jgi:hypothetical protein